MSQELEWITKLNTPLYSGLPLGSLGASLKRWGIKCPGIGRAVEVRKEGGERNKVQFPLNSCSNQELPVFPVANSSRPETLPGTAWHPGP